MKKGCFSKAHLRRDLAVIKRLARKRTPLNSDEFLRVLSLVTARRLTVSVAINYTDLPTCLNILNDLGAAYRFADGKLEIDPPPLPEAEIDFGENEEIEDFEDELPDIEG